MKKILLGFALIGAIVLGNNKVVRAQAVEEGNVIIDGYYGVPDFFRSLLRAGVNNSDSVQGLSVFGLGPVGGKVEYMISDKIGLGLDFNYTKTGVSYTDIGTDSLGVSHVYNYSLSRTVLRFIPRLSFHYGSDKVDGYSGLGVGYRKSTWKSETNDPNYTTQTVGGFNPYAFRLFTGIRYFFSDNLGANFEFGIGGGGLVNVGISAKF